MSVGEGEYGCGFRCGCGCVWVHVCAKLSVSACKRGQEASICSPIPFMRAFNKRMLCNLCWVDTWRVVECGIKEPPVSVVSCWLVHPTGTSFARFNSCFTSFADISRISASVLVGMTRMKSVSEDEGRCCCERNADRPRTYRGRHWPDPALPACSLILRRSAAPGARDCVTWSLKFMIGTALRCEDTAHVTQ